MYGSPAPSVWRRPQSRCPACDRQTQREERERERETRQGDRETDGWVTGGGCETGRQMDGLLVVDVRGVG